MTADSDRTGAQGEIGRQSPLPLDPRDLMQMRVRPADLARICSVSKQTVSRWIKHGLVTLGPDGRLEPARACREVVNRADPARLRARVFKDATRTHEQLRARIAELEERLRWAEQAAEFRFMDLQGKQLCKLTAEIVSALDHPVIARAAGELEAALDRIIGRVFYGQGSEADD